MIKDAANNSHTIVQRRELVAAMAGWLSGARSAGGVDGALIDDKLPSTIEEHRATLVTDATV
ncbi:MAG: hypothetical protein DME26_16850 [Verrucomicrobia bacterium]|nr:MAG: hypothetical protein DME26_16850 [Verrucomicrobiota bacterium]